MTLHRQSFSVCIFTFMLFILTLLSPAHAKSTNLLFTDILNENTHRKKCQNENQKLDFHYFINRIYSVIGYPDTLLMEGNGDIKLDKKIQYLSSLTNTYYNDCKNEKDEEVCKSIKNKKISVLSALNELIYASCFQKGGGYPGYSYFTAQCDSPLLKNKSNTPKSSLASLYISTNSSASSQNDTIDIVCDTNGSEKTKNMNKSETNKNPEWTFYLRGDRKSVIKELNESNFEEVTPASFSLNRNIVDDKDQISGSIYFAAEHNSNVDPSKNNKQSSNHFYFGYERYKDVTKNITESSTEKDVAILGWIWGGDGSSSSVLNDYSYSVAPEVIYDLEHDAKRFKVTGDLTPTISFFPNLVNNTQYPLFNEKMTVSSTLSLEAELGYNFDSGEFANDIPNNLQFDRGEFFLAGPAYEIKVGIVPKGWVTHVVGSVKYKHLHSIWGDLNNRDYLTAKIDLNFKELYNYVITASYNRGIRDTDLIKENKFEILLGLRF